MCVAKKYLQQVKLYDSHINNKLEEKARLEDLATRITTNLSSEGGFSGGHGDKVGTAAGKIVDLEREINESIDHYVDLKRQVTDVIDKVTVADEHDVLYKRYIHYMKWEDIAKEMNYSYQGICKLHGRALGKVREIINRIQK